MTKREIIGRLAAFDDDSDVVFITQLQELLTLESDGIEISFVIEVNNGEKTAIALME